MTLLSRKADYALLILSHLHQNREGGNARAIAAKFGISRAFVANILKELCQKGFVDSHRGVKGGYELARRADSITLAELMESIDDGFRLTMCSPTGHAESDVCTLTEVCTVKGAMTEVHRKLIEVLRGVSLATLFDQPTMQASAFTSLPLLSQPNCCSTAHC
jgi:Rrf2 family protein